MHVFFTYLINVKIITWI